MKILIDKSADIQARDTVSSLFLLYSSFVIYNIHSIQVHRLMIQ